MDNPLITVVVITYNSSMYILECLDSIYNQTYRNIELIISDDCSKDNTVDICRDWLAEKDDRFVRTKLVLAEVNTGVSANCNRGIRETHGEWIKIIAGDDMLLPNCLQENNNYVFEYPDTDLLFSDLIFFGNHFEMICQNIAIGNKKVLKSINQKDLKILLCYRNVGVTPTLFLKQQCIKDLCGYNEKYPFIEDWPLFVKAAFENKKFSYFDKPTVKYRVHGNSLSNNKTEMKNEKYFTSVLMFRRDLLKYAKRISILFWFNQYLKFKTDTSSNYIWKVLLYTRFFNPYTYILRKTYNKYYL